MRIVDSNEELESSACCSAVAGAVPCRTLASKSGIQQQLMHRTNSTEMVFLEYMARWLKDLE
jgi:hypothetical protein